MEEVVVLLLLLAGITHAFIPATDTNCNVTQNSSGCSVSLGGTVYIQVMANASGLSVRCKKLLSNGSTGVFSLKKEKVEIQEELRNRVEFFINNGTFKITNVERTDSGQYVIDVFDPNGVHLTTKTVEVQVVRGKGKENILPIVIATAAGCLALVMVVVCCCAYRRVRRHKQSASE